MHEPMLHSFGGSALDRRLYDFEAVADATEADVAASLETAPAGDPAPATEASAPAVEAGLPSPEPETPAGTPQIDWNDPQVESAVDARVQASIERMVSEAQAREAAANQPQPQTPAPPDPFSDNYEAEFKAYTEWLVSQATAGITPVVEAAQAREAQEWTNKQLDTLGVPTPEQDGELGEGDVATRDALLYLAGGIQQAASEAGLNVDGAQILQHAWAQLQARDARTGKAAVAAYKAELEGLDGAAKDPAGGTGALEGLGDVEDELALARLIGERRSQ